MKNFLFFTGIVLIVASCNQSNTKTTATLLPIKNPMTLNGYDSATAGKMVNAFLTKKGVYNANARTNIWFNKEYLDSLLLMLDNERARDSGKIQRTDGIRVYFAKELSGKYGFIIVSTRGIDHDTVHKDYFDHNSPFLNLPIAKGKIDRNALDLGAVLYDPKFKCKSGGCRTQGKHYVDCSDAHNWIINHNPINKTDTINTTSEWFELQLLHDIRNDLISTDPKITPDGIRIYYARKKDLHQRHHFLIVTTETVIKGHNIFHVDNFECPHNKFFQADDNGEQCLNNCSGTTWADQKTEL